MRPDIRLRVILRVGWVREFVQEAVKYVHEAANKVEVSGGRDALLHV